MALSQGFFKWLSDKVVKWQKVVPPFGGCAPPTSHVCDFYWKRASFFLISDTDQDFSIRPRPFFFFWICLVFTESFWQWIYSFPTACCKSSFIHCFFDVVKDFRISKTHIFICMFAGNVKLVQIWRNNEIMMIKMLFCCLHVWMVLWRIFN